MELLKDHYKVGLFLAGLFFLGIIYSIYSIYSLPHELSLTSGYQSVFTPVYTTLGITFILGGITIWYALQYKNEVIVFRDKKLESAFAANEANDAGSQTTISLESVKANLQQAKSTKELMHAALQAICKQLDAGQGAVYATSEKEGKRIVELQGGYALSIGESTVLSYEFGEGLVGQSAAGNKTLYVDEVPDGYVKIISGLGSASPKYLLVVPIQEANKTLGVMEIASFTPITEDQRKFVEESAQLIANSING